MFLVSLASVGLVVGEFVAVGVGVVAQGGRGLHAKLRFPPWSTRMVCSG